MIEEIDFQDTNNKVSITIDNETKEFPIKKINRLPTYIDLEQSLNTALENNIELKASIYYIKKGTVSNPDANESDINPDTKLNIDGAVTVTIYDGNKIYYSQNVHFTKGHIIDSIKNTLPLGSYLMTIEYPGSKYFEPSTLSVNFNVEKRLAKCDFEKERYYGDLTSTINVNGVLKDSERGTIISDCEMKYIFDSETHETTTDAEGKFVLTVTVPAPDINHCHVFNKNSETNEIIFEPGNLYEEKYEREFKDEDGNIRHYSDVDDAYDDTPSTDTNNTNTEDDEAEQSVDAPVVDYYPNASYLIDVYIDNDSYCLDTTQVEIIANKAPTSIALESTHTDTASNILNLHGSVLATYNNADNDIQYGIVNISLPDFNYQHSPIFIENKNAFTTDIDLVQVYSIYNISDIQKIIPYDTTTNMSTSVKINTDNMTHENDKVYLSANVGDMFSIEAQVQTTAYDAVKDGALVFSLYDNTNTLVYQYATELDRTGFGIFNFNTSRAMTYKVQAQYIGIFGYQDSKSEKIEVRVI